MSWKTRRHTKRHLKGYYFKPKRQWFIGELTSYIFYSAVSAVVFLLIYSIWFNPSLAINTYEDTKNFIFDKIDNVKINLPDSNDLESKKEDVLVKTCKNSFNTCSSIFSKKYGGSVSIIEIERFDDKENAEEFYHVWKGFGQISVKYEYDIFGLDEYNTPLVLIASKVKGDLGQLPLVLVCNSNGDFVEGSKAKLLCG